MKTQMKALFASSFLLCSLSALHGQTVMYGFEAPQLTLGQTTPLLNLVPDIGPGTFLASFTVPGGGSISVSGALINPAFSGQLLLDPGPPPGDTLRVTVNTPIRDVQLDFALMAPGYLQLQSSAGTINASSVGQSGSLVFHGASSFTQFDLLGFTSSNARTLLAIDNLYMTVPEPSVGGLALAGFAGLRGWRRWSAKLARSRP